MFLVLRQAKCKIKKEETSEFLYIFLKNIKTKLFAAAANISGIWQNVERSSFISSLFFSSFFLFTMTMFNEHKHWLLWLIL